MTYKLTREEQAQTLANYLPGGKAFAAKNIWNSQTRKMLRGFADELVRSDEFVHLFRDNILPSDTEYYIDEWESAVGIPCECFDGTGDVATRRLHVIVKLAYMAVQTGYDFRLLASQFGVECEIESGSVHGAFPYTFPIKFYATAKEALHTIVVTFTLPEERVFPYEFPIVFSTNELLLIQCIFNRLKPAHVNIVYENL